ncbi:MAG TPA: hypothetical protein VIC62_16180 [Nakamurella sp.]
MDDGDAGRSRRSRLRSAWTMVTPDAPASAAGTGRRAVRLLAHPGFSGVAVLLVMVATLPAAAIVPRMTDPEWIRTG